MALSLLLIPANRDALSTMKKANLKPGARFHLTGNMLDFQSGQIDGHVFNGRVGNTGYFLVETLQSD